MQRSNPRFRCAIEALACTPIEARPARIVDLSRAGAKVQVDAPFTVGARIHLDVGGDFYWGMVVWTEVDRMGVRFRAPVATGTLEMALRRMQEVKAGLRRPAIGFGRRQG